MKKITPISIDGVQTLNERTYSFGMFGQRETKATGGVGNRHPFKKGVSWIATEEDGENEPPVHVITVTLSTIGKKIGSTHLASEITFVVRRKTYKECFSAMLQMLYERNVAIILPKREDK
jgi:hypothetical protein